MFSSLQKAKNKQIMDKEAEINILKEQLLEKVINTSSRIDHPHVFSLLLYSFLDFFRLSFPSFPFSFFHHSSTFPNLSLQKPQPKLLYFNRKKKHQKMSRCREQPRLPHVRNTSYLALPKHLVAFSSSLHNHRKNVEWHLVMINRNHTHPMKMIKLIR